MDEVITPDGDSISITHDSDYLKMWFGELHASSEGKRPAMGSMQSIKVNINGKAARTADAGDENYIIFAVANPVNDPDQGIHKNTNPTAGTPDMRELLTGSEVVMDKVGCFLHDSVSSSFSSISIGVINVPSTLFRVITSHLS